MADVVAVDAMTSRSLLRWSSTRATFLVFLGPPLVISYPNGIAVGGASIGTMCPVVGSQKSDVEDPV